MEEQETPVVAAPVKPKRNWRRLVLYMVILLLALSALGGVFVAATSHSIDPASVKPPVITADDLAQDQKAAEPMTPINQPIAAPIPEIPKVEVPQEDQHQTDAPMQLPSQKETPKLLPTKNIAPQSMISLPPRVASIEKPITKISGKAPQIVIVIDDMGLNMRNSRQMASMDAALTLSYMPYAGQLQQQVKNAFDNGHELIVHMPMEPDDIKHNNPGPDALLTTNSAEENVARLNRNFAKFNGYVIGMNNHMGSRMTSSDTAMRPVMQAFKDKGMWFLDSRTIGNSVAGKLANEMHIPYVERDVFLDNTETVPAILSQLKQVEQTARRKGYAVAIGHPYNQTIEALRQWIPQAKQQGFKFVPLSAVIAERFPATPLPHYARADKNLSVAVH